MMSEVRSITIRGVLERLDRGVLFTVVGVLLLLGCIGCSQKPSPQEAAGIEWLPRRKVASGGAFRGPWRMNRSTFRYVDDPNVELTSEGEAGVVWVDQSRKDVLFQRFTGSGTATFEQPVNVSRSSDVFSWFPTVVISPGDPDRVYVLWQEIVFSGGTHGGEIYFSRSTDGGRTFLDPVNLSRSTEGDGKGRLTGKRWDNGSLDLAVDSAGRIYAAWTEYEGRLRFASSGDRGRTFSEAHTVAGTGDDQPARGPSLSVKRPGEVVLAWTVGEDPSADIRLDLLNENGRSYGTRRTVHPSSGHADAPKVAVDERGTIHLAYSESRDGPFQPAEVYYSRMPKDASEFEDSRRLSEPLAGRYSNHNYPSLALDGSGNPYVAWELFTGTNRRSKGLGFTRSTDRGRTFANPSVIPGSEAPSGGLNGSQQGFLMEKLSVGDGGRIAVVNSDFIPGRRSRIWLIRGRQSTN